MTQFPTRFDPNVSYLLVGGLGGLGRSIAQWMVENGAKYLIFLSRSGTRKPEAKVLEDKLKGIGTVTAVYACDVGDKEALQKVLHKCSQEMPPIRGVIQGAMILQDSLFETMTCKQFRTVIRPKVQGSWNLHSLLPRDMDFFTMLSSSAGIIGSRGQGNYAAGNTYQDALATYRRAQGLAASTIDLGLIVDVGYAAENVKALENIKRWGFVGIAEQDFLRILQAAIASSKAFSEDRKTAICQFTTGIGTGGVIQSIEGGDLPYYFNDARFSLLRNCDMSQSTTVGVRSGSTEEQRLSVRLENARNMAEVHDVIDAGFRKKISKLLMVPLDDISVDKPLHEHGVDSLVAVEIRNWIFHETRTSLSVFDILSNDPISALCEKIALGLPKLKEVGADKLE
jgi:NAD(P)-dependent dehydrogenase (short-subunit alcohol dehydrogenase family)